MAIARIATNGTFFDTPSHPFVVTNPSTASGQLLLAGAAYLGTTGTWTVPTGWTQIGSTEAGTTTMRSAMWWKISDGTEGSTISIDTTSGFKGLGVVSAYSGTHATTPIDASAAGSTTPAASTTTPSVTVATGNAWLWLIVMGRHSFGSATLSTSDGSDVSQYSHGSVSGSGFDFTGRVWDSNRALSTGSASRTITTTSSDQFTWGAVSIKPASAAPKVLRVYMGDLAYPVTTAPPRLRVYRAALENTYATTPGTLRVYRSSLAAPRGDTVGGTGIYAAAGGTLHRTGLYMPIAGGLT